MKAIIDIRHDSLVAYVRDLIQGMDNSYYASPCGARSVLPAISIPGIVSREGNHPCGLIQTDEWVCWTRSSGTVVALRSDGQLRVAGSRHSINEILDFTRWDDLVFTSEDTPQFSRGIWYRDVDADRVPYASVSSIDSCRPECDPLRPVAVAMAA